MTRWYLFALLMKVIKISQRNLIEIAKEMEQKKSQVKLNMTYYYTGNKGDKKKSWGFAMVSEEQP